MKIKSPQKGDTTGCGIDQRFPKTNIFFTHLDLKNSLARKDQSATRSICYRCHMKIANAMTRSLHFSERTKRTAGSIPTIGNRMMKPRTALWLTLLFSGLASGATIEFQQTTYPSLVLKGEIKAGDAKKLIDVLTDDRARGANTLGVNSPGGSVDEAIRIAKIVKALYLSVVVMPDSYCASACFFIYLAGSGKVASGAELMNLVERRGVQRRTGTNPSGFVGLHRPFLNKINSLENKQAIVMRIVSDYLENEMLPRRLIDLMMSRPSNDIYWLSTNDLDEIGDYSPEQEEFLIRRCSYTRKFLSNLVDARNRRDNATIHKILHKDVIAQDCINKEMEIARKSALDKINQGWRPY